MILKVTKKQSFTLSSDSIFFEVYIELGTRFFIPIDYQFQYNFHELLILKQNIIITDIRMCEKQTNMSFETFLGLTEEEEIYIQIPTAVIKLKILYTTNSDEQTS